MHLGKQLGFVNGEEEKEPSRCGREGNGTKEESPGISTLGKNAPSLKADRVFWVGRCFRQTLKGSSPVATSCRALRKYGPRLQAASEVIPASFKRSLLKTDTEALRQIADLFVDVLRLMVLELATS